MSDFIPASPDDLNEMASSGFDPEEVASYRQKSMDEMAHSGFSSGEIQKYYGVKEPDMSGVKRHVTSNIQALKEEEAKTTTGVKAKREPIDASVQPVEAKDMLDGLAAGWGTSFTGLFASGAKSPIAISENASRAVKIASMVGQFAGDIPAMAAGFSGGAALGTVEAPVVGTIGFGVAGAFAAPSAMRKMLVDQYEKGDVTSAGDFADRVMAASWEGMKGAVTGLATEVTGGLAGGYLGTAGKLTAEAATMATVSSGLEGHLPEPDDFINGLVMMGGFHAVSALPKMYKIYERTGLKPEEVVEKAETDPVLKQEILSVNEGLPNSLEPLAEKDVAPTESKPKTVEEPEDVAKARENIRSKIGEKTAADKKGYSFKDFYQEYVDRYDPVKDMTKDFQGESKEALPTDKDPYKLARMANDYKAKVKHTIENGTLDFETLAKNGKGLNEILTPIKSDMSGFEEFIVAKRALELEGQGRESGFDVGDAQKVVSADASKYGGIAKELVDYQNRNLKYLYDSGRVSKKAYGQMLEMGKSYIPFSRLLEPEDLSGLQKAGKSNPLKRLKGSDLAIQNPILSIVENTEAFFKLAESNRAKSTLVEMAEKTGNSDYFKKVPSNKIKAIDAAPEVNKLLEDIGVDFDVDEFKVYRAQAKNLGPQEFEVFRDGKREVYEVQDERAAKALKALDGNPASQNLFMKIARQFTSVKRIGTTLIPDFIAKNFTRDQLTAGVFSEHGTLPFRDVVWAMGDIWKQNDSYYNWLKSGGANGAFLELNSKYIDNNVFELNKKTGFIDNAQNVLSKARDVVELAGNIIESAPRLAEFKRASGGESSGPKVFEGGYQSREITVDFQRMGLKTQALNSIAAFMNAQVQGLDRTMRALKEDPVGTSIKAAAYLTAPTVLLWAIQKDDERYKEIPQWEKDLFWCVVHNDWQLAKNDDEWKDLPEYMVKDSPQGKLVDRGSIFRIPKPQELGLLFATVPERILEAFLTDHPDAMKGLASTMWSLATPNWKPDIATPIFEHAVNYNSFTSRPLVPQYLEKELPAYRYTEYTSESAKALGKILGTVPIIKETSMASPMVIENYVKGWTGTLGSYALQLVDLAAEKSGAVDTKPAWSVADIPFVKAFAVRNPTTQAESIQRFYDRAKILDEVMTTSKNQMKKGHFGDLDYIEKNYGAMGMRIDTFKKALSTQGQLIRGVNEGDYTQDDKRQLINAAYYHMIETARLANSVMDQYEKIMKDDKQGAQ